MRESRLAAVSLPVDWSMRVNHDVLRELRPDLPHRVPQSRLRQ